jgi:hypothetical protein
MPVHYLPDPFFPLLSGFFLLVAFDGEASDIIQLHLEPPAESRKDRQQQYGNI